MLLVFDLVFHSENPYYVLRSKYQRIMVLLRVSLTTVVLWSKSSTLDRKVEGLNPAAANFSFEVDDLDARRKKEDGNEYVCET